MTLAMRKQRPAANVSDAARQLGKLGGRPRGSYSSPLARWLRAEVRQKQREGWGRREAFDIAANTERRVDADTFELSEWTADEAGVETVDESGNERPAIVRWDYWRKIWQESLNDKRFP